MGHDAHAHGRFLPFTRGVLTAKPPTPRSNPAAPLFFNACRGMLRGMFEYLYVEATQGVLGWYYLAQVVFLTWLLRALKMPDLDDDHSAIDGSS